MIKNFKRKQLKKREGEAGKALLRLPRHPRRLLLFLASHRVTDERVTAPSEVATKPPHHACSRAASSLEYCFG